MESGADAWSFRAARPDHLPQLQVGPHLQSVQVQVGLQRSFSVLVMVSLLGW